ncbi:ATP-dependent serine protease [Elysia marginata]|uniref:ATP-dependent serine protease n=1 Tax=Elysia marginata TaxID=1093978 RepID=A0AAV4GR19_9GAST|nr:ATP-dependent serine protease [Elysia marginata]
MSQFGKVIYASAEQGDCNDMKQAWKRNGLLDMRNVYLGVEVDFSGLLEEVQKRGKRKLIILDSIDYINLTKEQYQELHTIAKRYMMVFTSWSSGSSPKTQSAKDIEYMCNGKIRVEHYVAFGKMRSGGNVPYVIYEARAKQKHSFVNR